MKKLVMLMFFFTVAIFSADIKIPIQGYLTDNSGVVLNGEQNIKFSLYDIDQNGNSIWSNQDYVKVNIENGEFSYMLGTTDFIDSSVLENSTPLYLEVEINDEILSPRVELGVESKAIYAYKAENANSSLNSEKLEGKTLNELKTEVKTEINTTMLNSILARLDALESDNASLKSRVSSLELDNTSLKSRVSSLESDNASLKSRVSSLESELTNLKNIVLLLKSKLDFISITQDVNLDDVNTNKLDISNLKISVQANNIDINEPNGKLSFLANRVSNLEAKTSSMSILTINGYKTVRFSHVNLQIVNGTDATDKSMNGLINGEGLGNLIIGYNELRGDRTDDRTGYNNLVVGSENSYSSYGGMVIGHYNTISGPYSSVSGGIYNTASGYASSVSGGNVNNSSGTYDWRAGSLFEDQ